MKKEKCNKLKVECWQDGVNVEYREYAQAYTVWAVKGKVGVKLERGGLKRKHHNVGDCFERAFRSLEKYNPFDLSGLPKASSLNPCATKELDEMDLAA